MYYSYSLLNNVHFNILFLLKVIIIYFLYIKFDIIILNHYKIFFHNYKQKSYP